MKPSRIQRVLMVLTGVHKYYTSSESLPIQANDSYETDLDMLFWIHILLNIDFGQNQMS